jgi:tetratricopeptide (TPR) repeat protein
MRIATWSGHKTKARRSAPIWTGEARPHASCAPVRTVLDPSHSRALDCPSVGYSEMRKLIWIGWIVAGLSFFAVADEGHHHEEVTQDQLGTVHFSVSCTPDAQKTFQKGVALLHSFWYEESEKAFTEVAQQDPKCAMAYWGEAISHWHQLWDHPNAATIKRAEAELKTAEKAKAKTDRERDYIGALKAFYSNSKKRDHEARARAYSEAMEKVYQRYPDDHEAAAFYALSLLASEPHDDTTFVNRKKAGAILDKLFDIEPNHPGIAHYLIHTYDKPQLAELGLPAARRYAQVAPAAPHALHMPSHIFARLGMWQEDIDSNLASVAATRQTAALHMGGEGHQFHAMDFLMHAYLQNGREADALKLIEEVRAMPAMKDMYGMGYDPRTSALVAFPARVAMELHHWSDAASLAPVPGAETGDNSITYWARAIGAARSGNVKQAREDIAHIESVHQELLAKKKKDWAETVEDDKTEATAWLDYAEGKHDAAIAALRTLVEKEESTGEAPDSGIPAREMLADMLLDMKQGEQALVEYKASLKFAPNRFNSLYGAGQAAEMAGQQSQAAEYYAQVVKVCEGSSSNRPELAKARQAVVAAK